jgi:hypothetical protein
VSNGYGMSDPDDVMKEWSDKWYWVHGEPTIDALVKATEDAIKWIADETDGPVRIPYGMSRLIIEAEKYLETHSPADTFELRRNVKRLRGLIYPLHSSEQLP